MRLLACKLRHLQTIIKHHKLFLVLLLVATNIRIALTINIFEPLPLLLLGITSMKSSAINIYVNIYVAIY